MQPQAAAALRAIVAAGLPGAAPLEIRTPQGTCSQQDETS